MKFVNAFVVSGLFFAGSAMAKESFLEVHVSTLGYSMGSETKTPDGGTATTTKSTELSTDMAFSYFVNAGKFTFNLYPSDSRFGAGFSVMEGLDVGLDLVLNAKSEKVGDADQTKSAHHKFIPYVAYTHALGSGCKLEAGLELSYGMLSATEIATAAALRGGAPRLTATTVDMAGSEMDVGLAVNYVHSLTENVAYAAGVSYEMHSHAVTKPDAAKSKTSMSEIGLNLAELRFSL